MVSQAAQDLWNARVNDGKLPFDFGGHPDTETAAYQIQTDIVAAAGLPVIGWKIGATVEALFEVLGVQQPFLGPLFEKYTYDSGAEVAIQPGQNVETEITVRLKSDLPWRDNPYSRAEIEAAVHSVAPSFEIVGTRFEGDLAGAGFRVIADGGANVGTILGSEITDWADLDLGQHPVTLEMNGQISSQGNTSVLLWDHIFDAVVWAAQQPVISKRGLLAGDIIMTGTCTGITALASGDLAVGDFGELGKVRAHFI
jgi:2-keto-4-pentenoate hydratase